MVEKEVLVIKRTGPCGVCGQKVEVASWNGGALACEQCVKRNPGTQDEISAVDEVQYVVVPFEVERRWAVFAAESPCWDCTHRGESVLTCGRVMLFGHDHVWLVSASPVCPICFAYKRYTDRLKAAEAPSAG